MIKNRTNIMTVTFGFLWLVIFLLGIAETCYKFPADVKDPCEDKECHFGAQCRPSPDGTSGECICPEKCATYGDSRGSRPVCGTDGQDYPNVCELRRTACRQKKEIEVKFQGPCGKSFFKILLSLFHLSL
ncbi:agrin [Trichonephila clavata]|uniref:Agrin n=1 Tax=Trichonephila clavata TaxID=2740835 RepID=A0A8X6K4Z2_TRICU|nr:agrin [Trichonephila clavata]